MKQSLDVQRKELNDCRAEITALKMYIEGAQSSKKLFAGNSDGLKKSHSIATSMAFSASLNKEDENSNLHESTTNKRSAVGLTEDAQKDHQDIESSAEGPPDLEAPDSCPTDENGGYGTSEEDKSVLNGNLHGASTTGKSQGTSDGISVCLSKDRASIEKLESPSKQKSSDKMVSIS
jgi:hypothetical protein